MSDDDGAHMHRYRVPDELLSWMTGPAASAEMADLWRVYHDRVGYFPVIRRYLAMDRAPGMGRWDSLFTLLSTRRAAPFLPEMGLGFIDSTRIRPIAQEYVEEGWRLETDGPDEFAAVYVEPVEHALDRVESELGHEVAERLWRYALTEFPALNAEQGRSYQWASLLDELVYGAGRDRPPIELQLPGLKSRAVIEAVRRHLDPNVLQRINAADDSGDEWTRRLIEYHGMDNSDWSELDTAWSVIEYRNFRRCWYEIRRVLDEDDLVAFLEWGNRQAERTPGVSAETLELPEPDDQVAYVPEFDD